MQLKQLRKNLEVSSTDGYVFIVTIMKTDIDLFYNWACSVEKNLMLDVKKSVLIITISEKIQHELEKKGFLVLTLHWLKDSNSYSSKKKYLFDPNGEDEKEVLFGALVRMIGYLASNEIDVISISTNTFVQFENIQLYPKSGEIIKINFFEYFNRSLKSRDLIAMYYETNKGEIDSQFGNFNFDFVIFKSTFFTERFIKSLELVSEIKLESHQEYFNTILRHYRMQQLTKRLLSKTLFPIINDRTNKDTIDLTDSPIVNIQSSDVRKTLKDFDLWLLEDVDSCSLLS